RSVPLFQFGQPKPNRDEIRLHLLGPKPAERQVVAPLPEGPSFLEIFLPFMRRRRLEREAAAKVTFERGQKRARAEFLKSLKEYESREKEVVEAYNSAVRAYNGKLKHQTEEYARARDTLLAHQEAHNSAVLAFRCRYEAGSPEAVERYMQMV